MEVEYETFHSGEAEPWRSDRSVPRRSSAKASRKPGRDDVGDDVVTWCFGHIYELLEPEGYDDAYKTWRLEDLPIVPKVWRLRPKADAKEQIKVIKGLISKATLVVNAGDPDREGQLLVDEVLEELGCRTPVKRIWLAATDERSVKKALCELRDNAEYQNLKDSAQARSWGDWLVGMNATRKMTLLGRDAGLNGVLSVGRVQTPTLSLIVVRDQAIQGFKSKDFYGIRALFNADGIGFMARWTPGDDVSLDDSGRVLDKNVSETVAQKISGKLALVSRYESKEKSEAQPLAFSLDKLQMECNKRFGLSAQETLDVAQKLYEAKVTSYPRTDSGYLPESQHAEASEVLKGLAAVYPDEVLRSDLSIKSRTWNNRKVTAHHGIIPTGVIVELKAKEREVFDLIVRRYLAQFYSPYRYLETTIELTLENEKFSAKGRIPKDQGWKALFAKDEALESDRQTEDEAPLLPALNEGESLRCEKAELEEKKTTPPERFTEASLLQAMLNIHLYETDPEIKKRLKETAGIGTPATRANIIETLKKRGFVEEKKKSIVSTEKGRQLIEVLPPHMKSPGLTALFEELLESVATGEISKENFLERQIAFVSKFIQSDLNGKLKAFGPIHPCPTCKKGSLRKKLGGKGAFWACSKHPDCGSTFDDIKGMPSARERAKAVISDIEKCQDCGKGMVLRKGKKGAFWGCSGYPACKRIYEDLKGKPKYA